MRQLPPYLPISSVGCRTRGSSGTRCSIGGSLPALTCSLTSGDSLNCLGIFAASVMTCGSLPLPAAAGALVAAAGLGALAAACVGAAAAGFAASVGFGAAGAAVGPATGATAGPQAAARAAAPPMPISRTKLRRLTILASPLPAATIGRVLDCGLRLAWTAMYSNSLKHKLAAGQPATIVAPFAPSPGLVEFLGHLGFDGVFLDCEHGSSGWDDVENLVRAADLAGYSSVVRVERNDAATITRALDRGAGGVQVPHVNTAAEAQAAVEHVKFAPLGHRGWSGGRSAFGMDMADFS